MFKHYLLISWRNIIRRRFYTIILIAGLAIGMATSILLGLYTTHELSYDSFHEKKDRVFLVGVDQKEGSDEHVSGWTTPPTGPALQEYFPQIESMTRLCFWFDDVMVIGDDIQVPEKKLIAADSTIFNVFSIPFVVGDAKTALKEPNSIVLTETAARKYFKDKNPMGQVLKFEHFFHACKVTGIVKDYPHNSHFDFEIILSLNSLQTIHFNFTESWDNHTFSTYVLLDEKANIADIEGKLDQFVKASLDPFLLKKYRRSFEQTYAEGNHYKLFLTPLEEVHLSTLIFENREGKKALTYALVFLAITVLILVCINYTNLASVLSMSRAKEAAIRKISGSRRRALFLQLLLESMIMAFAGLFMSLGIVEISLPAFNALAGQQLNLDYSDPHLFFFLAGFTLFVGILSGLYPAANLATSHPILGFRSMKNQQSHRSIFRNALVIFQFSICMIMIVSTIVVFKQVHFMTNKDAGFVMDQVLVINRPHGLGNNKLAFKGELLKNSDVTAVSYSETTPGRHFNGHGQHFKGDEPNAFNTIYPFLADEDILDVLGLTIISGKGFVGGQHQGARAVINETAATMTAAQPLEQIIDVGTMGQVDVPVVGVVKDFHFKSFHHVIEPMVFYTVDPTKDNTSNYILIRLNSNDIGATVSKIEKIWKAMSNGYLFEYSFLDKDFEALFEREKTTAKVYTFFCSISIFIACLGLLGLASFFAERRTKEIGIRKIAGASVTNIAVLLSKDFGKLIVTSIVVGGFSAWWLMQQWLENFAYKTDFTWWIFVMGATTIGLLAMITVGWHLSVAAKQNPVDALRHE